MEFNLDAFLKEEHARVQVPFKKDYSGQINLSSNQLESAHLRQLFVDFLREFDPVRISQYTHIDSIRSEIATYLGIAEARLLFTPGSDILIYLLLELLSSKISAMVINAPNYQAYFDYAVLHSIPVRKVNLIEATGGSIVDQYIEEMAQYQYCLVVISNPENFFGYALNICQLKEIMRAANRNQSIVLLDEAYADFSSVDHQSLISEFDNLAIIKTLSKSFGLAGLRLCQMKGTPQLIAHIKKTGIEKSCSIISLLFYSFLLQRQARVDEVGEGIIQNREYFKLKCNTAFSRHWKALDSETNFISLLLNSKKAQNELVKRLRKKQIAIKAVQSDCFPILVRITVPESREVLDRILLELDEVYHMEAMRGSS